jgi:hypothetical protein
MKKPIPLSKLALGLAATSVLSTSCADLYPTSPAAGYRTGEEAHDLPEGTLTETVSGTRYYSHKGTYYRPEGDRYVVVDPPSGRKGGTPAYVDRLPPGYYMKRYAGEDYFVVGDKWYRQRGTLYLVVDRPF